MLIGILQVGKLPPQCTFWRFLTSLPVTVAQQLLKLQRLLRERVWEAANVQLCNGSRSFPLNFSEDFPAGFSDSLAASGGEVPGEMNAPG